jgi:hypothetical protein
MQPPKLSRSPKRPRDISEFTPSAFLATPLRRTGTSGPSDNSSRGGFEPLPPVGEQVMDIYSRYDFFRRQKDDQVVTPPPSQQLGSNALMNLTRSNSVNSHNSDGSGISGAGLDKRKSHMGLPDVDLSGQSLFASNLLLPNTAPSRVHNPIPEQPAQNSTSYHDYPLPVSIVNSYAENSSASIVPLKVSFKQTIR